MLYSSDKLPIKQLKRLIMLSSLSKGTSLEKNHFVYKKSCIIIAALLYCLSASAQTALKVYHGASGESQVYDNSNRVVIGPTLKMVQGETFTVEVVNANTLFYKYSIKFDDITVESEDKVIANLLATFGSILTTRSGAGAFIATSTQTDEYKDAINLLTQDINDAKKYIQNSDIPETPQDALDFKRTAGLRQALYQIRAMPNAQFRLNNSNLLSDLNALSQSAAIDDIEKQAFSLLNSSLVEKVNDIKKQCNLQSTQTVWRSAFKVSDSPKKITLIISKIDKSATLVRDGSGANDFELTLGTIVPYYKRAVLEIVPVANFIFSDNVREFYIENSLVNSRFTQKTTTNAGAILNVNFVNFGETKEMAVGAGVGYKISAAGDEFKNFYLSTLFSYKNFLRFGFGFGFAQFPKEELKGGVKIGQALPANISNINDLLQFEEKPSVFLTLSFTGLSLTQKK